MKGVLLIQCFQSSQQILIVLGFLLFNFFPFSITSTVFYDATSLVREDESNELGG